MKRICMWSGPRNVSTAMLYAFHHRGDCKVVDEPFYSYYLHASGVQHPGRDEILASQSTEWRELIEQVIFQPGKADLLFIKNMPHHLLDMPRDWIPELTNFFLVREPRAMIASYAKKMNTVTIESLGLDVQWELFSSLLYDGLTPIVVDNAVLLENPESVLRKLCQALEIPFKIGMLNWPAGPISADGVWASYWYHSVHASTGWKAQPTSTTRISDDLEPLAVRCELLYQKFEPFIIRP